MADRELKRLRGMSSSNAQYSVSVSYLECLAEMPWGAMSAEKNPSMAQAQSLLDAQRHHLFVVRVINEIVGPDAIQQP